MFIFNFKVNKNLFSKTFFVIMLIIIISIFIYGVYIIFLKDNQPFKISDNIKSDEIFEINENNYANILKASSENLDSYVGCKVHITGYIYRLLNFEEKQFVIARDMTISPDNQTLVIGFLCEYEKAKDFPERTWVDITGVIKKGNFNGEIALLEILTIQETQKPENPYVKPPDNTYIPTSNMF